MSVRALPGGDTLGWDCGNLLVFLALAMFVQPRLGGSDPLPSCRNNLLAAPNSEQCMDACASSSHQAAGGRSGNDPSHVIINLSCSTASTFLSVTLTSFLLPPITNTCSVLG